MAGYLELTMRLNADLRVPLRFETAPGIPEDVTGIAFVLEVRPEPGSEVLIVRAENVDGEGETGFFAVDPALGSVILTIRRADLDLAAIGSGAVVRMSHDLLRTRDGLTLSPFEGPFVFQRGVSVA